MSKLILALSLLLVVTSSCKKEPEADQAAVDEGIITRYISDHKLDAKATGSGLYYVIEAQGTGAQPTKSSNVTVKYKGYFTDGTTFDQSSGYTTNLGGVIAGWTEGIPYFKEGGTGKLLIPSALAYGDQGVGDIPPNTVLIFDITLVDVK